MTNSTLRWSKHSAKARYKFEKNTRSGQEEFVPAFFVRYNRRPFAERREKGECMANAVGMTSKQWLPLIGLAFSAFMLNTSEFMPIGLLVDIAADFSMTEAEAGAMISVYALAVLVLSLPLMIAASRFAFKGLMLAVIAVFGAGQLFSALAPNFALAHAVFWSIASPMAVYAVDYRRSSLALSCIATGSAVAVVCGLPLGRAVGLALGWRMTFACVAVAAFVALVYLWRTLPKMPAGKRFTVKELPALLKIRPLTGIFVVTVVLAGAHFVGYSYIEPFLLQVVGMPEGLVTVVLAVYGAAGILGSALFSRLYGIMRFAFVRVAILGVTGALALMAASSATFGTSIADCVLWGMCYTAFNVAFQAEVLKYAPADASAVAMSIYSGLFNLGISGGTQVGGMVVAAGGIGAVGYVGAAFGVLAFVLCGALMIRPMRRADALSVEAASRN